MKTFGALTLTELFSFFDADWYIEEYTDVKNSKFSAWEHYKEYGFSENRYPCKLLAINLENKLWSGEIITLDFEQFLQVECTNALDVSLSSWYIARWYGSQGFWEECYKFITIFFSYEFSSSLINNDGPWLLLFSCFLNKGRSKSAAQLLKNSDWPCSTNKLLAASMLKSDFERFNSIIKVWGSFSFNIRSENKILCFDDLPKFVGNKSKALFQPLVSVIVPCYNSDSTITTALISILSQTWENIEVLVVDDCSTDNSLQRINEVAFYDNRLFLIKHDTNKGAYAARNTALEKAKGQYITVHDSDDWSHPEKIKLQVKALRKNRKLKASISHWVRCDDNFNFQRWRMEDGWIYPNISSLMFKRDVVKKIGFWDNVSVNADTEYFRRILKVFGNDSIGYVLPGVPLAFGRVNSTSLTQQSATHLRTQFSGVRKDYMDAALKWHEVTPKDQLYLSASPSRRPFPVPNLIFRGTPAQKAHNDQLLLQSNPLFDAAWYLEHYPDVKDSGLEPLQHYCLHGARENRDPGPLFSTSGYRYSNPDLEIDCNPLVAWQSNQNTDFKIELAFAPILGGKHSYADAPSVIMCGHLVTEQWFGAERSFLDVLSVLSTQKVNVIAVLPSAMCTDYVDRVRELAQQVVIVPYRWWRKGRAPDSDTVGLFNAIIRRFDASLLYTNTLVLYEPLVAAKEMDVTSVVHARELAPEDEALCSTLGASAADVRTFILEHADHVIANSLTVAQYINDERCYIVPNMIRVDEFSIGNMPLGARLAVGMLSSNLPKKGLYDFVELARWCQAHNVPADFKLFGSDNAHVQKLRMGGELPSNLNYCGYVDKAIDALKGLDIVVNLSHFQESFGRSVLEAMAAKRCVVAYQWGALTELVKPQCGYLVPFQDIESVAKQILYLCDNRSELCDTAENAVNMVRENYEQQQFAKQLLAKESPFSMLLEK